MIDPNGQAPREGRDSNAPWRLLAWASPVAGLFVLLGLSLAFGQRAPEQDTEAFLRAALFELKSVFALSPRGEAFDQIKQRAADAITASVDPAALEPRGRRFLAAARVVLGRGGDLSDLIPADDPARPYLQALADGKLPPDPQHVPPPGVEDAWLESRLRLKAVELDPAAPPAALNLAREHVEKLEREQLERLSTVVGVGSLLFLLGVVFLVRLRSLLRLGQVRQVRAPVVRLERLPGRTVWRLLAAWCLFHVAASALLPGLFAGLPGVEADSAWPVLLTYWCDALVALGLIVRYAFPRGERPLAVAAGVVLPAEGMEGFTLLWALGGVGAAMVLVFLTSWAQQYVLPEDTFLGNPGIRAMFGLESPVERGVFVANVGLVAPLFEEAFFRAFLYNQLRYRLGVGPAAVLSATVFAFVHLSLGSFLPILGLGLVLALAYEATGSLSANLAVHGIWNAGTALVVLSLLS
jgi:membrane protease YdiL (CAAX protease family)